MLIKTHHRDIRLWLCALALNLIVQPAHADTDKGLNNQLENHPSPYLALHGSDPVAWQDWQPAVIARAKRENKLILLSSGYFSCHWCHVMQRESYQNDAVAQILNKHFISVKIDRELEPALDKRLMTYAQATIKRGGWPLNVFMSPDGLPVYAVLYQPQPQFLSLLEKISELWQQQSTRIRALALDEKEPISFPDTKPHLQPEMVHELHNIAIAKIMAHADTIEGGFGQINKFPSVPQLTFLLNSLADNRNPELVEFLHLSLRAMADNGMRDHLAGGFYRYVVDPAWEIPHFEKMLYDNANLALLYLKAGEVLNNPGYTGIARDTLDFMMREMRHSSGALYASFSAVDDQDVEGGYYLWEAEQLKNTLSKAEYQAFSVAWQTDRPNELEGGNHLRAAKPLTEIADHLALSVSEANRLLQSAKTKLIKKRAQRVLPTDDKLLASWNALALSAFAVAAKRLDEPRYRQQAEALKTFIMQTLWRNAQLTRSQAQGQLIGSAAIEDYAYVAEGLLRFAELSGEDADYQLADAVLTQGWRRFYQNNAWSYADSSLLPPADGEEILAEDASRSPSASIIQTTIELYNAGKLQDEGLYQLALSALNRGETTLRSNPFWYVSQIGAMKSVNL